MDPRPITAADAKQMLDRGERVTFVDTRNPMAWGEATQKLPNAVRIPVDAVDEHLGELPAEGTLITYCT